MQRLAETQPGEQSEFTALSPSNAPSNAPSPTVCAEAWGLPSSTPLLGFFGRLWVENAPDLLVRAMLMLSSRRPHVCAVGLVFACASHAVGATGIANCP